MPAPTIMVTSAGRKKRLRQAIEQVVPLLLIELWCRTHHFRTRPKAAIYFRSSASFTTIAEFWQQPLGCTLREFFPVLQVLDSL